MPVRIPAQARRVPSTVRPVVTGLGIVAPSGIGVEQYWASTLRGELAVVPISRFDTALYDAKLAGEVTGFEPEEHVDQRYLVQTDRWTWFGMAASGLALADADYDPSAQEAYATAVVFGSGSGGNDFGQRELQRLWSRGRTAVSVYQSIAWFYAATTGQTSIRHGLKGPSGVVVSDGAGGLDSLAQARRVIRRGTGAVLAGGAESGLTPYALTCHQASGRVSTASEPAAGYKPFDVRARGYLPGEGGVTLLVEDPAAAAVRGAAQVYGEIAGYAATHDAVGHARTAPDGRWLAAAMRRALADAELEPDDIDVVFADGAGSPDLDAQEAAAIRGVFGARPVPVTAPQGLVGRLCAGGSALSVAAALLAIRDGVIPAVGNLDAPDPAHGLDLVVRPRPGRVRTALVNARGYGGFNSTLIVRAVP
ncbi:beta-ketoacyl synthase N-terminal-like domain-containing protein [Frankia sp. AiPa1]|uniref:beta-ketoacyl synthase N-terminal-like domain-containing protein n=1 Tax=Frankia sp. AiPa1 TaxID=573492 RepID=UPI00202BA264|nr:beta-ketoacyl synthase N-terminal-like domain-containing protein [Frankia sp. AiPa1]MCL9761437.1 ketosynthase chain-length factor [Frankia sp. AiPa1]